MVRDGTYGAETRPRESFSRVESGTGWERKRGPESEVRRRVCVTVYDIQRGVTFEQVLAPGVRRTAGPTKAYSGLCLNI